MVLVLLLFCCLLRMPAWQKEEELHDSGKWLPERIQIANNSNHKPDHAGKEAWQQNLDQSRSLTACKSCPSKNLIIQSPEPSMRQKAYCDILIKLEAS